MLKQSLLRMGMTFFFCWMLLSPKVVFSGASSGLLLWFEIVLPTLFPFLLISNLLMETNSFSTIVRLFGRPVRHLFQVSQAGSFAVICGFLCGYPMGAKITADLLRKGQISDPEAVYLLSFCNNTSPAFIVTFLVWKNLQRDELLIPTLVILFLAPFCVSLMTRRRCLPAAWNCTAKAPFAASDAWNLKTVDTCMMNSFETLLQIGGYILIFSILLELLQSLSFLPHSAAYALAFLEITTGIHMLCRFDLPVSVLYPLVLALTASGGICAAAQTKCMLKGTDLPFRPYLTQKLTASAAASVFALIYLILL